MSKTVKIGGGCGFLGDSSTGSPPLIKAGIHYLMLDYLAEVTMSGLGMAKRAAPETAGYARDFTDWIWKDNLKEIVARGVKVVTNAGGTNPAACRRRMEEIAKQQGYAVKIAIVEGDDLLARAEEFAKSGVSEMFSKAGFPPMDKIVGINAYLGAFAIARAFSMGADHVITGRVVDSALGLAPLVHEFGWSPSDYNKLASGTLMGHILECGAQATGGLFTDWKDVPDWAHIGYPIAECEADGSFVVTKPEGTGGLVTVATVSEQLLYEIGDPQGYIVPDVVCDFSTTKIEQAGQNRVRVSNVTGYAPTSTYKVCATFQDGYRTTSITPILGMDAPAKAKRQSEAVLTRCSEMLRDRNMAPFRATRIDVIGSGATYGRDPDDSTSREVMVKVSVEHEDEDALKIYTREYFSPATSMSVGTTAWYGLAPSTVPVVRLFSFLLAKNEVTPVVDFDGDQHPCPDAQPAVFRADMVTRPGGPNPPHKDGDNMIDVPLVRVAWGRSGDKGDAFNVGIIARKPELLPYIRSALSPEFVTNAFAHEFEKGKTPKVQRFDLPGINAVNFLIQESLGGGGAATLRVDMLAKGKAQQLLDRTVQVPARLVA